MKTTKYFIMMRYIAVLCLGIILFVSCNNDDNNDPRLSVVVDNVEMNASGDSNLTLDLKSNVDWTITSDQQWLDISITTGNGNATITLGASANSTNAVRTATISITYEMGVRQVTIKQNFSPATKPNWALEANVNKEYTITYVAQIKVNNETKQLLEGDELAAFIGDQCRGIAQLGSNSKNCFILIFGNQSDVSQLKFKYFCNDRKWIFESEPISNYYSNQLVGSPDVPFNIDFN